MRSQKRTWKNGRVRVILAFICVALGILSLLGLFGITDLGRSFSSWSQNYLGQLAWLIPLIFLALAAAAILVEPAAKRKSSVRGRKNRHSKLNSEFGSEFRDEYFPEPSHNYGASKKMNNNLGLPSTKLVTLKGFEDYFAKSDNAVITDSKKIEEFKDLGPNLKAYLNEGKEFAPYKPEKKWESLRGLTSYLKDDELDFGKLPAQETAAANQKDDGV